MQEWNDINLIMTHTIRKAAGRQTPRLVHGTPVLWLPMWSRHCLRDCLKCSPIGHFRIAFVLEIWYHIVGLVILVGVSH
jgi:hypothetical protein